ncbi:hypothetical protein FRC17_006934 [Serendipita sp. 399]|nr:hypothetical protein FRC17_006934 [Serendipita sp. 399]
MRNFGAEARASLSQDDINFLVALPKAELHAHLNGCIPLECLQRLARDFKEVQQVSDSTGDDRAPAIDQVVAKGLRVLEEGVVLEEINQFFDLFPAIYALTSTPATLRIATRAVLTLFLQRSTTSREPDSSPQCDYLELRTTPRENEHMTRREYLETVLAEMEIYPREKCALIVSLDRRMKESTMMEVVEIAAALKKEGKRVVGIDLCGPPTVGEAELFLPALRFAREQGLKLTLHIAETRETTRHDVLTLLSVEPSRLGHATFLDEEAQAIVLANKDKMAVEICLSSNLLCNTVNDIKDHHINWWLENGLQVAICTDDTLVFRNSLLEEYALLMARPPLGLGLSRDAVRKIAMSNKRGTLPADEIVLLEETWFDITLGLFGSVTIIVDFLGNVIEDASFESDRRLSDDSLRRMVGNASGV